MMSVQELLINQKEEKAVKEKEIKDLLDKVVKEIQSELARNNEIGSKLKEIMKLIVVQNQKIKSIENNVNID